MIFLVAIILFAFVAVSFITSLVLAGALCIFFTDKYKVFVNGLIVFNLIFSLFGICYGLNVIFK